MVSRRFFFNARHSFIANPRSPSSLSLFVPKILVSVTVGSASFTRAAVFYTRFSAKRPVTMTFEAARRLCFFLHGQSYPAKALIRAYQFTRGSRISRERRRLSHRSQHTFGQVYSPQTAVDFSDNRSPQPRGDATQLNRRCRVSRSRALTRSEHKWEQRFVLVWPERASDWHSIARSLERVTSLRHLSQPHHSLAAGDHEMSLLLNKTWPRVSV